MPKGEVARDGLKAAITGQQVQNADDIQSSPARGPAGTRNCTRVGEQTRGFSLGREWACWTLQSVQVTGTSTRCRNWGNAVSKMGIRGRLGQTKSCAGPSSGCTWGGLRLSEALIGRVSDCFIHHSGRISRRVGQGKARHDADLPTGLARADGRPFNCRYRTCLPLPAAVVVSSPAATRADPHTLGNKRLGSALDRA